MKRKIGFATIVVLMSGTPVAWGQLSLTVIPEKTEYVVQEPVYLTFREPDREEREIIDALWAAGMGPFHGDTGQFSGSWPYDEARLRDVVRRFPGHPLIVHARLALAKTLQWKPPDNRDADLKEAKRILESLIAERPYFRPAEVRVLLGRTAVTGEDYGAAAAHLAEGLRQMPFLAKNYVYMRMKLWVDDPRVDAPNDAFGQWRRCRREGVPWKPEELKRDD
jgi:hypothetical protein